MSRVVDFLKKQLPFYALIIVGFYLFPLVIFDLGSAIFIMAVFLPILVLGSSIGYAIVYKYRWEYALIVAILYLPTIWIFYNMSAWIYALLYGVLALIGNGIGEYIKYKNTRKNYQ